MSDIEKFLGSYNKSGASSPFRSVSFLVASIIGLGSVLIDLYLICRHWDRAPTYVVVILSTPIGAQLLYQWVRVVGYRAKVREIFSKSSNEDLREGSPLDVATRISARGMLDLLFFNYGIAFFALMLIGALLWRLDGRI